jgi:trimeric autotransporter adhesin
MNRITVASALWLASMALGQAPCSPSWSPNTFVPNGPNGSVLALAVFDDGTGSALYAGGTFTVAGGAPVNNLAKWNGSTWSDAGGGTNGTVSALAVFDDGTGLALYAGGAFTSAGGAGANHVAKWNGTGWSPLGAGIYGDVSALTVFGAGPAAALYAGGTFSFAGTVPAANVARWSLGGGWSAVGGLPGSSTSGVKALATYDDGTGPALYAGGIFTVPFLANNIFKWDGIAWSTVGTGIITTPFGSGGVNALAVHDEGGGPALFAGGSFTTAGGVSANSVARWNGVAWSALGTGLNGTATSLASYDDGSGPALYASGFLSNAGGTPVVGIARWSGGAWSALGTGIGGQAWALAVWNDGTGPALVVGGYFTTAGSQPTSNIAKFTTFWQAFGADGSIVGTVNALAVFDDGSGPHVYAGGMFTTGAVFGATNLAKWEVSGWTPVAPGIDGPILSLAVFDDGGGPRLYAAGGFTTIGGVPAGSIARWNGATWAPVGGGFGSGFNFILAMTVFDDGTGPALYVSGVFTNAGGNPAADYIAKWDGAAWSAVGTGVSNGIPWALTVHDDGSGPALVAGGDFTGAGGLPANRVAKWNGTAWAPLGGGVDGSVRSLATHVLASGQPVLVAGGDFTHADGLPASHIAAWNGAVWAPLGAGLDDRVQALHTFDDGGGPALWAGGGFSSAGGAPAMRLAKWNGSVWSAPGNVAGQPAPDLWVRSLLIFDDGSGPALHVGGQFSLVGGVVSTSVARRVPGGSPLIRTTLLPQIVSPGGAVTISVEASGTWPLFYQWQKNGVNLPGATSASHQIASAAAGDAGSYAVTVSNTCGSAASNAATLSVIPGLATYGTATAGCAGFSWIAAISPPQVGNAAFFLAGVNAPPGQQGLCAVSGAPLAPPLWVSSLSVWIDPGSPALFFINAPSDAGGLCIIPAGLPPDPGLAGLTGFVQMAWPDACAGGGLAATNAVAVTIVP